MDSCGGGGGRSRCTWWVADVGLGWLRKQADRRTRGDAGGQVVRGWYMVYCTRLCGADGGTILETGGAPADL